MTTYKVLVSHVNSDYTFEPSPTSPWSQKLDTDESLIVLLNRIAISSSQIKPVEYPEVEVTAESRRAFITIVDGHIYYTERDSNRQNLHVVAENVPDLLKGLDVHLEKPPREEHASVEPHRPVSYRGTGSTGGVFRFIVISLFIAVIAFCSIRVWKELAHRPSLLKRQQFEYQSNGLTQFLDKYAGLYVNAYRDGSLVLELEASGKLHLYELWRSPSTREYIRVPISEFSVQYGYHKDKPALLADSKYLVIPQDLETLTMYGLSFSRHDGVPELGAVGSVVR